LPNWLEDDVLCLGLRRVLSSFNLKNPIVVPLDVQEQMDRGAAAAAAASFAAAREVERATAAAAKAAETMRRVAASAAERAERAMPETAASNLMAWEAFAVSVAAGRAAETVAMRSESAAASAARAAKIAGSVSRDADARVFEIAAAQDAHEGYIGREDIGRHVVGGGKAHVKDVMKEGREQGKEGKGASTPQGKAPARQGASGSAASRALARQQSVAAMAAGGGGGGGGGGACTRRRGGAEATQGARS